MKSNQSGVTAHYFCSGCNQTILRETSVKKFRQMCETAKRVITLVKVEPNKRS